MQPSIRGVGKLYHYSQMRKRGFSTFLLAAGVPRSKPRPVTAKVAKYARRRLRPERAGSGAAPLRQRGGSGAETTEIFLRLPVRPVRRIYGLAGRCGVIKPTQGGRYSVFIASWQGDSTGLWRYTPVRRIYGLAGRRGVFIPTQGGRYGVFIASWHWDSTGLWR